MTIGEDIARSGTRSLAPPTSAPSSPPTAPTTGQTEVYIYGKHWGPDAARQAGLAPAPTLRDRVTAWFPGIVGANPTYDNTDQCHRPAQFNSPWPGSLVLLAASASLLAFRHRFAVQRVPFGAILVNPKTKKPLSQAASPTQQGAKRGSDKIGFGMPLTVIRDPTFSRESVSLDEAISQWHTVYRGMAAGSGILAAMAVWNVAFSPKEQHDGTLAVGQLGEKH